MIIQLDFHPSFSFQFNTDETVEVLSPSGDIYQSTPFKIPITEPILPEPTRIVSPPSRGKKGSASQPKQMNNAPSVLPECVPMETSQQKEGTGEGNVSWKVIGASGEQWRINNKGEKESLEELLVADASCFESDQVKIIVKVVTIHNFHSEDKNMVANQLLLYKI